MIRSAHNLCLAVLAGAALSGCSWNEATPQPWPESNHYSADGVGQAVVDTATSLVGSPYRYGAHGPNAFDCSGLVYYSYQSAGVKVPRTSAQQFSAATPVRIDDARPGDLLFFRYSRKVSHVGIYLGDQRFVHAPSTGGNVSIQSLQQAHYRDRFVGAGRID
ncbi:MAG: C40 family peptidase [Gammaproteobacteria bacterium]